MRAGCSASPHSPTFLVTLLIIGILLVDAVEYLTKLADTEDGLGSLFDIGWFPRRGIFDIGTLVVGTLIVTGIAMLIARAARPGCCHLSRRIRTPARSPHLQADHRGARRHPERGDRLLRHRLHQPRTSSSNLFSGANRAFTLLAAGIGVGILTIPIIASVAEDSLRAVPMALREAAFGLGAQRHQTSFRVVVPAGISGIVAAFILGMSRAIGETMVVAIAAGAVGGGLFRLTPLEPGQTMTAAMAALGFGSDQVAGDDLAFQSLYFVGLLLFCMTFLLNFASDRLVARVREVY